MTAIHQLDEWDLSQHLISSQGSHTLSAGNRVSPSLLLSQERASNVQHPGDSCHGWSYYFPSSRESVYAKVAFPRLFLKDSLSLRRHAQRLL